MTEKEQREWEEHLKIIFVPYKEPPIILRGKPPGIEEGSIMWHIQNNNNGGKIENI